MKKAFALAFFVALLAAASAASAAPNLTLALKANPTSFAGPCPLTIKFTGLIEADVACSVSIRVVRSDGWKGDVRSLNFTAPGRRTFEDEVKWSESFKGWVALEATVSAGTRANPLVKPLPITSNTVNMAITCAQAYDIRGTWTVNLNNTLTNPPTHQIFHVTFSGNSPANGTAVSPDLAYLAAGHYFAGLGGPTGAEFAGTSANHRWVFSGTFSSANAMSGSLIDDNLDPNANPKTKTGGTWTAVRN